MSLHQQPLWRYAKTGLALQVGDRTRPLPPELADWLLESSGVALSTDPAVDLIRAERELQRRAAHDRSTVDDSARRVASTRAAPGPRARRRWRRRAEGGTAAAIAEHASATAALWQSRALLDALHDFVVDADVPAGLLADAARGWRRDPDPPAWVIVFESEELFLAGDARRATATSSSDFGVPTIAGQEWGRQWRRDGDDDLDAEPPNRAGRWALGFLARTGEVYAVRRAGGLPWPVWLLAAGVTAEQAGPVLTGLLPRMHEPNSVVLAAELVENAVAARTTPHPVPNPEASELAG